MGQWLEVFRALGLFGAAAAVGFWLVALILYTLIQVLALWLPQWGAAAVVTGLTALAVAALALIGWSKLKRLESPGATLGRRWQDHREWWDRRLLATPAAVPAAAASELPGSDDEEEAP